MVGCFLFHRRNGLHVPLFIARSGEVFIRQPDRWRDWACGGRSARVSATHPASCPATPAVVVVDRVHGEVVALPGADCLEDSPAAARSVVPVSPAVSPAVRSASRLLMVQTPAATTATPVQSSRAIGTGQSAFQRRDDRFASRKMRNSKTRSPFRLHWSGRPQAGAWQTASILWPSGSSTNAP
jgi:hypothetical protein